MQRRIGGGGQPHVLLYLEEKSEVQLLTITALISPAWWGDGGRGCSSINSKRHKVLLPSPKQSCRIQIHWCGWKTRVEFYI